MKRAPIVMTGTACGLVAAIGYHAATPTASALTTVSSSRTAASTLTGGSTSSSSSTEKTSTTAKTTTAARAAATTKTATASSASSKRSAVGSDIEYQYGDLEVKVTMTGSKITDVSVVRLDVTDPRSESIDQYAIPGLRSEALQAQSAHLDGISGASYTSAAYEQSLQSAIDKLKA